MFLVSGITGQVGGAVARRLLEQGRKVRALVRDPLKAVDWADKGVEIHQGDLGNAIAVADALHGVDGAFLMIPPLIAPKPGFPEARAIIASYVDALGRTPPPRLALLSSFGSEKDSGLGLITSTHLLEEALSDLPFPTAIVRAGGFIENNLFSLGQAASTGELNVFYQPTNRAMPTVATVDVGNEIARLLTNGWEGRTIVEVGSYISPDDIALSMTEVLGRPIEARAIARDQWSTVLQMVGLQPGQTWPYEEMIEGVNSGWIDFGVLGTERVEGTTSATKVFASVQSS